MDCFCLVLSANKEFDDWCLLLCSELSSFDLLYVEGEMSDFWKPQLSDIYCFGSGIFISKLQFTVRSEILFDIGLWVYCIGVVRWEEILPILYVMFVIRLGDRIRRDSGMKLDFVCVFVRKIVCIELWFFILVPVFLFRWSLREEARWVLNGTDILDKFFLVWL